MLDLLTLLEEDILALDGVTVTAEDARQQLGIALLDPALRTLEGQDVAVYPRISDDKAEDQGGVRRQGKDTVAHAVRRGARSLTFYVENDTSAYKKKRIVMADDQGNKYWIYRVIRPRWQSMLMDLRSGVQRAVCVYDIDRLARDPRDLEDAIELAEFYKRRFEGTTGSIDLNTDSGRAMARVMVVMANKQSADTARRVKRKHQELAEEGRTAGGPRPFGWLADRKTLDKTEAKEVEDAIDKVLADVSVSAILADWLKRGIKTSLGNDWKRAPFLYMLRNPRLCGYRGVKEHQTRDDGRTIQEWKIVKKADGTEVRGQWEAIISREKWDALIEKIGATGKPKDDYELGNSRKYELAGLARCGLCKHHPKMSGSRGEWRGKVQMQYRCESPANGGCGRNARIMGKVDELIRDLVFKVHDAGGHVSIELEPEDPEETVRLADINELLNDLYVQWKAKDLPSGDYFAMRKDLDGERQELLKRRATVAKRSERPAVLADVRHNWKVASIPARRAFIAQYLSAVIIHPIQEVYDVRKKRMLRPSKFNPDLIEPVWR